MILLERFDNKYFILHIDKRIEVIKAVKNEAIYSQHRDYHGHII